MSDDIKPIAERLREDAKHHKDIAYDCDCRPESTVNWEHMQNALEAASVIEALQKELTHRKAEIERLEEESLSYENASRIAHEWGVQISLKNCELCETNEALQKENAELKAEVKEWLCLDCNTVFPSESIPNKFSCLVCPDCNGRRMPKSAAIAKKLHEENAAQATRITELTRRLAILARILEEGELE